MVEHKKQGNNHVIHVKNAIESYVRGDEPSGQPAAVKTAEFILGEYKNIGSVRSKFDFNNADSQSDLTLYLNTGKEIKVNLFTVKGNSDIQPKNVGAKSFISKYFLDESLQAKFNEPMEKEYNQYLADLYEYKTGIPTTETSRGDLKQLHPDSDWKFDDEDLNEIRDRFLFSLRENCFNLLQDFCNSNPKLIENAYKTMLMVDDFNIVTRLYPNGTIRVEKPDPTVGLLFKDIKVFKSGGNTVSILCGSACLRLRFKFESDPLSSVKLAISHKQIDNLVKFDEGIRSQNLKTLKIASKILNNILPVDKDNKSNAIGKCNEALVYLELLRKFPDTIQVDSEYCLKMLESYAPLVKPEEIEKLKASAVPTVDTIIGMMNAKYNEFTLESIQLVPESYVADKLDTSDLQLNIRHRNTLITENLSLKAISDNKKVTLKNPGIGKILVTFFPLEKVVSDQLKNVVSLAEEQFKAGESTHTQCLKIVSDKLGELLQNAAQELLRQGIENLLGKPLVITTVYNEEKAYIHERQPVSGEIKVETHSSSPTLAWDGSKSQISLRVKFSKGQEKHGWSSLKLAVEQKIH
ncbi:hypothetical protein [Paenibacillus sp. MMS18-CY102]|uniref:hypothetical protein n=1 Tax=Paenibacillus sp. MMS18-CY102 TaxID=2682849 RepID=UPI0013665AE9|nr:hypothetical protein [Paenibacillus sp. MMS18-CY102]MWC31194.1 hypothetical protein [Paenibacillus sp. MMS18-CY102]